MSAEALESYLAGSGRAGRASRPNWSIRSTERCWRPRARADSISVRRFGSRARGNPALRTLTYAERAKLLGKVADVLAPIARATKRSRSPTPEHQDRRRDRHRRRHLHAEVLRAARRLARRRARPARRRAGAPRQGREVPGHPPADAPPRRRRAHQRLQFPELGPVGEGRARRCLPACRSSPSRPPPPPARAAHGARRRRGRACPTARASCAAAPATCSITSAGDVLRLPGPPRRPDAFAVIATCSRAACREYRGRQHQLGAAGPRCARGRPRSTPSSRRSFAK